MQRTQEELEAMPDYILKYFAPMVCGELERKELTRRYSDNLNKIIAEKNKLILAGL